MRLRLTQTTHLCSRFRHVLSLVVLLLLCAFLAHAADQPKGEDKPKDDIPPPLFGEEFAQQRAATALFGESFGSTGPLRQAVILALGQQIGTFETDSPLRGETLIPYLASSVFLGSVPGNAPAFNSSLMLYAGEYANGWSLDDPNRFRPLEGILASVRDNAPLASLADRTPAGVEEAYLLQDGLLKSLRARPEAFDRVARSNFTVEELREDPARYRGRVLQLHGFLRRIRLIDAPARLKQFGAPQLYEVWVLVKSGEISRQVCLLTPVFFGFAPTNDPPPNIELELTGYFFKKLRFEKGSGVPGQPDSSVPLLLGRVRLYIGQDVSRASAAAAVVAAADGQTRGALTQAILLRSGEDAQCWAIEDPSRAPPLDPRYIDGIKDNKRLPRDFDKGGVIDPKNDEQLEAFAYWDALSKAHRTRLEVFEASVQPEVTFAHLHNEPQRYRGKVVRIDGMLRRVRRFEPFLIEKQAGIKDVYEVWLVNDKYSARGQVNPVCLLCTQLPPGIKVTEDIHGAIPVSFVGYFFKKYRFTSVDTKDKGYRESPLIIGHLVVPKKSAVTGSDWTSLLVPFILLTLAGTFVVVFLMTWTFRRADRRVLARVDSLTPPFAGASEPPDPDNPPPENEPPLPGERRI